MGRSATTLLAILAAYIAGLFTHMLYQRWNPPPAGIPAVHSAPHDLPLANLSGNRTHPVHFAPLTPPEVKEIAVDLPLLIARDIDQIRTHAGGQARVRGRVFRVGYSAKSNTYFLNFGPSREALTAVIFASSVERFEKTQKKPKLFENKEVEMTGEIQEHPQYGLEIILDNPEQIKILHE